MTAVAVAGFVLVASWYILSYRGGGISPAGMMGQMMGYQYGQGSGMPEYVWVPGVALLAASVLGVVGLAYYLTVPPIKAAVPGASGLGQPPAPAPQHANWGVLMRTSKPEERRVLEIVASHQGSYLQKFIVKESGLSRLKTHRVVSRLAERGIVTAEKTGNTNMIRLASWLTLGEGVGGSALPKNDEIRHES